MESADNRQSGGIEPGVLNLTKVITFQEGSIVSRQILKKEAGNVTLFAFDAGQGLTEHTSPFDAFVQVLEGEAEVTISKRPFRLQAGEAIMMPSGRPHALKATSSFKMLLTMIRS